MDVPFIDWDDIEDDDEIDDFLALPKIKSNKGVTPCL
jgi:hypothetical protein